MNQELLNDIGQILRNRRVKRDISLEKISENTKISIKNIVYIEKGEFHKLPGVFYQKSFLRIYAKYLRIKPENVLKMYEEANPITHVNKENVNANHKDQETKNVEKFNYFFSNKKLPTLSFLLICLISFFFIITFKIFIPNQKIQSENYSLNNDTDKIQNENYSEDTTADIINEIESLKQQSTIQNTNLEINETSGHTNNLVNTRVFRKEILATEDVWLEIKDVHNNSLIATLLKKNETFMIPNEEDLKISVSNAGAIKIKNGDILSEELGSFGNVLKSVSLDSLLNKY